MTQAEGRDAGQPAPLAPSGYKPPSAVQRVSDTVVSWLFLWAIPRRVRPNHLTVVRFVLTPVVLVLFAADFRAQAVGVFVLAAVTDFLDGAMARTRDQITPVGIIIDPIADKLLIGAVLLAVGWEYLVIKVIAVSILVELAIALFGVAYYRRTGEAVPANVFGKIKMMLLSVGVALFLAGRLLELPTVTDVAVVILWVALAFALLSPLKFVSARRRRASAQNPSETASGGGPAGT
jgi:CDP-diacylglycerol--glycerol-3-phosphate 3-phosphatidyltransferase